MDKIIFRIETITLMIIFASGVVTPLLVLKLGLCRLGISLSITLAFFCVFSLLPFLKGVNGVLKYDIGIGNLNEEIMEAIELGYKPRAVNKIEGLTEMGESAFREYREDVILRILRVLSGTGIKSAKLKLWNVTYRVVIRLKNIGLKSAEKGFQNSTRDIVASLRYIATDTLKEIEVSGDLKEAVIVEVLRGLSDIGVKAAEKGLTDIIEDVAEHLTYIGRESGNKDALSWLWCLGAATTKYMSAYVVDIIVIRNIKELEETIIGDWMPSAERDCTDQYPDLKDAFENFKKRYNEESIFINNIKTQRTN
jgi:hypothetical protein